MKEPRRSDPSMEEWKKKYEVSFLSCINSEPGFRYALFMDPDFTIETAAKFVSWYEERYPERRKAFDRFFRKKDPRLSEVMLKLRCMTYMLDEEIVIRMTDVMKSSWGIYMEMSPEKNPKKGGASAYFGRDLFWRPRIRYYEIEAKGRLSPPYKTFFHEFGHGLDDLGKRGRGFYSDNFSFTQEARQNRLRYDEEKGRLMMDSPCAMYSKTIHQWMAFDVENHIIRMVYQLVSKGGGGHSWQRYLSSGIGPDIQLQLAEFVTYQLFLQPEGKGMEALNALKGHKYEEEIRDFYQDIQEITNQEILKNAFGMIVLPKDLFGGITNNQLGGGHSGDYWFGRFGRKREVSREAFAGYFEYRTTVPDDRMKEQVINPYHCILYTVKALEGMLSQMFEMK